MDSTSTLRTVVTTTYDSAGIRITKTDTTVKQTSETILSKKDYNVEWIKPVTELISAYAWPIVVIILLIIFKKQISVLIGRIKEITISTGNVNIKTLETKQLESTDLSAKRGLGILGAKKIQYDKNKFEELKILLKDKMINKILSTFWKYQRADKSGNHENRWTFTLLATNNEYQDFIASINVLYRAKLVEQNMPSQQFYLTNDGIAFCELYQNELNSDGFKI
ncbi:MAG: hypothetical protein PHN88_09025 [Ignavibacteria bacterium]|nr:hypothetical protein [Ignavibacteria bacterium]